MNELSLSRLDSTSRSRQQIDEQSAMESQLTILDNSSNEQTLQQSSPSERIILNE